jgi:hypothetical protein
MGETTTEEQNTEKLNRERNESQNTKRLYRTETQKPSVSTGEFIFFFPLAVIADLLGGFDITGFGAIPVRIIDIFIVLILWLWRAVKGTKGVTKNYTFQLFGTFLLEMSPFGIIPAWSAFVLYTYFMDRKFGKQFLAKKSKEQRIKNKK